MSVEQEEVVTRTPLSEVLASEADNSIIAEPAEVVPETDTGEPVPEVDPEAAPPAEETKPEVKSEDTLQKQLRASIAQANDERGKRQALQGQLEQFKAQQQQVEKPDAFVNPDEAIDYGVNAVSAAFNDRLLNLSESQARGRHDDFDAMKETFFNEVVVQNPVLGQQAMQAPDPYEFVYQQAKTHNEFSGISSMDEYKVKVETEMRVKLEAEYAEKAKDATNQAINNALPQSLSTATATGGNQTPTWAGPTSLNDILGKK